MLQALIANGKIIHDRREHLINLEAFPEASASGPN
jgi:hypothetical protein